MRDSIGGGGGGGNQQSQREMINCERLIGEVYKREPLWNSYNVLHRSAVATNTLWGEVAEILGVDCHSVKKKWKGLRDYYRTELKKMYGHKPGDTTINLNICSHQVSTWPYYDLLHFLKDSMLSYYVKPKNHQSTPSVYPEEEFCQMELTETSSPNGGGSTGSPINNFDSSDNDPVVKLLTPREQQIKTAEADYGEVRKHEYEENGGGGGGGGNDHYHHHNHHNHRDHHDNDNENAGSQTEVSLLPLPLTSGLHTLAEIAADPTGMGIGISLPPKKTKRARMDKAHAYSTQMLELERHKLAIMGKESSGERETDDDDYMFLKSLLPDIKTLPRSRKLLIRMKMQEMVYNEISKLENDYHEYRRSNA